jgi:hypothetical protein
MEVNNGLWEVGKGTGTACIEKLLIMDGNDLALELLLSQHYCEEFKMLMQELLEELHPDSIMKVLEVKQKYEYGGFSLADRIRCIPAKLTITIRLGESGLHKSVDLDGTELVSLQNSALRPYLKDLCRKLV